MKDVNQTAATRTKKRRRNNGHVDMILPGANLRGVSLEFP